jgi:hypothetical protein
MTDGKYKVTYSFNVEYENLNLTEYPKDSTIKITFDGTDVPIDVVVGQFVTFLKAAGYIFDDLEVIK